MTKFTKARYEQAFTENQTCQVSKTWQVYEIHNPAFNYGEFAAIKSQAGLNSYKISVKEWVEKQMPSVSAFFFKQWGTWGIDMVKRGKKANGRLLLGKHGATIRFKPQPSGCSTATCKGIKRDDETHGIPA